MRQKCEMKHPSSTTVPLLAIYSFETFSAEEYPHGSLCLISCARFLFYGFIQLVFEPMYIFRISTASCDSEFYKCKLCEEVLFFCVLCSL